MEWVQCEGPSSVISVCLPNIFNLGKLIHTHGLRSVLRGGKSNLERRNFPGSVNSNNRFIKMKTRPRDRQALYLEESGELETDVERGGSIPGAPARLNELRFAEQAGV